MTLPANQTVMTFSGDVPLFGMMRLESSGQVKKTTVWDMDRMLPGGRTILEMLLIFGFLSD